ncbi:MAG: hypothetical protein AAFR59_12505, partial [Bacteroidota bacterium]
HPHDDLTDHVRVWFALPQTAFPENFDYNLHPEYISTATAHTFDTPPRFFSIYGEYTQQVSLKKFKEEFDYPQPHHRNQDTFFVPPPRQLQALEFHYGIVGYDLYPDERPATLVNQQQLGTVSQAIQTPLGNLTEGLRYKAEFTEGKDGYVINAQFSPQALGFVQAPNMQEIRLLVEIGSATQAGQSPEVLLSSNARPAIHWIESFSRIFLGNPLQTDVSQIPSYVFDKIDFRPIYIFGEQGWIASGVDVDGLVLGPQRTSQQLTEVLFYQQDINFSQENFENIPLETLSIDMQFVNQWDREREYTFVMDQILELERQLGVSPDQLLQADYFRFPDGGLGKISQFSSPLIPYAAWDSCPTCKMKTFRIQRIVPGVISDILSLKQINGPLKSIQVGNWVFDDFVLEDIEWVQKGRILLLGLGHARQKSKKRIKVSWEDDGSSPKLEQID